MQYCHVCQGFHILRETASSPAKPSFQKSRSNPFIQSHPPGNLLDICSKFLAHIGNFIDVRNARRKVGIGGILDHFSSPQIGDQNGAVEGGIQICHFSSRIPVEGTQDHPIRIHEVINSRSLA